MQQAFYTKYSRRRSRANPSKDRPVSSLAASTEQRKRLWKSPLVAAVILHNACQKNHNCVFLPNCSALVSNHVSAKLALVYSCHLAVVCSLKMGYSAFWRFLPCYKVVP
uniref:Uncharacterized protein n=1 Tax=Periophthalmus magnuspinnatus TaxID=409849 RepID=A0A3B4AZ68_9GOBI